MRYSFTSNGVESTPDNYRLSGVEEEVMVYLIGYIATIYLANLAIQTWGLVPVGFGLMAPAGVYAVGVAFTLRDLAQDALGKRWVIVGIFAGAALSALVSPQFALASGAAFLMSEALDMAVYTPLRERNWVGAVVASNVVGLVVDSIVFLWLAFGSLDFLAGQVVGKAYMTVLAVMLLALVRMRRNALSERRGAV
jgi:uncharacterized PurR-regulated membrane protein YhhQ (DUF165 family)